jgi:hypothetical protein
MQWTYSDSGAAVVVYPKIVVGVSRDTVLTLTNESAPKWRRTASM